MTIYQPYFYIIQEVSTGMYYAGAKWAKDANPSELLQEGGYITSSETIKELISRCGLDNFTIRRIRVFETATEAQDYETKFLLKVDARRHTKFYNQHNNDGAMNSIYMKNYLLKTYGVDHNSKMKSTQEKRLKTIEEKYGSFSNMMEKTGATENSFETCEYKYGTKYNILQPDVIEKREKTSLQRYGTKNPFMNKQIQEKGRIASAAKIKKETDEKYKEIICEIKKSNIDFSKRGWVGKASIIIGIKSQKVSSWMKRHMPDFYYANCLIRKVPIR